MAGAKILVVEDEALCAMEIQKRLVQSGYKVAGICTNAESAVRMAAESKPALVLMDIMLEGRSSGIEAARQIRSLYNIPVVFLTAYSDDATVAQAKLTEPYGYLPKPFDGRTLRSTIEVGIHRHKADCDRREKVSAELLAHS
jgi:DNA-binding response OmpR family regulator